MSGATKTSTFTMRMTDRDRALLSAVAERESDRLGFRLSSANLLLRSFMWYLNEHHPDLLEAEKDQEGGGT